MLVPYWIRRYFADNYHTPECWVVEEMSQNENIKEAESSGNNCLEKLKFYVTFSAAVVGKGRVQKKKMKKVWNFPHLGWLIYIWKRWPSCVSGICSFSVFLFLIPFVVDPALSTINHDFVEEPVECRVVLSKYILGDYTLLLCDTMWQRIKILSEISW